MLKSRKGSEIYRDTLNREIRDRYVDKISIIMERRRPLVATVLHIGRLRLPCLRCDRLYFRTVAKLQVLGVSCAVHEWMGSGAADHKASKQWEHSNSYKEHKQWWNPYETSHRRQFVYQPTSAQEILLHKHPVSTTFKDSSSHPGPLGSTVYNEEYYWKPQRKPNHICTGTASGHWRNNPHPSQGFFVWRFPRDTPRCSAASPQKRVPCDGEICKALGAQYCSIYTRDFKGSSQGPDENNKQNEKLAALCIKLQKRESLPADTEMRASYRPPKQKPELLPNIYQHSNMDQRALCHGIVPTVIQRHVHTQQRGTNQTTYDMFFGNSVNYLPPDIKALPSHETQQLKTILHDEGQETGKAALGKNTCSGNQGKTKELAAVLQNLQSPVWTSSWPGPL